MIYTIGIQDPDYEGVTVQTALQEINKCDEIQCDLETEGLFFRKHKIKCLQLGTGVNEYVIHPQYIQQFKEVLESKLLILHNAKFDLKFLYTIDIWPNKVYDTFVAECVLYCGDEYHRKSMGAVVKARLSIDIDKSLQKSIAGKEIKGEYIQYSADDVKYLQKVKEHQWVEAEEKDLKKCINLENDYVLVLAYIEYCGIKLDKEKWLKKMEGDNQRLLDARSVLNKLIFSKDLTKYIDYQLSLWDEGLSTTINWDSPKQVIELFTGLGIDCWETVKGVRKQSASAKSIEKYQDQYPFIKDYLHYKELQKVVGTYGQSFIRQIDPETGRIYTKFSQIMDTGRTSCGGKEKSTGEEYINLQNLPNNKETRTCFISDKDNVIVDCDYSSMEVVALTNKSMEPGLLEFFDSGYTDFHSYNALKIYPELQGLTHEEVKKNHNTLRQNSKVGGFTVSFGGVGKTVADNLKISLEEGDRFYKLYFEAFPKLKDHYKKCEDQAYRDGYILIDTRNKRKCFIYNHQRYKELSKQINKQFWDKYKPLKANAPESSTFLEMKAIVKEYFSIKGDISRKSYNFPIQGECASIAKIAGIRFMKWIREHKLFNKVLIVSFIHDQLLVECSETIQDKVKEALVKAMEDAGLMYYTRVKLKASAEVDICWSH